MSYETNFLVQSSQNYSCSVQDIDATEKHSYMLGSPMREKCFGDFDMQSIKGVYSLLYPFHEIIHLERFYFESKQIHINGELFTLCVVK